ncbi:MAG: hypothetical protein H7X91_01245 [Burkholderiales bacterium]|nr:hypothetical protein [Burkholderiales bacterium]
MLKKSVVLFLLLALAGCAWRSPFGDSPKPPAQPAVDLSAAPIAATVAVFVPRDVAEKRAHFVYAHEGVWFPEGEIIAATSLRGFAQAFQTARPADELRKADVIVKVGGNSVLNPMVQRYYVDAFGQCLTPEGRLIEEFRASAVTETEFAYTKAFDDAYFKAFREIAARVAVSDKCRSATAP